MTIRSHYLLECGRPGVLSRSAELPAAWPTRDQASRVENVDVVIKNGSPRQVAGRPIPEPGRLAYA